MDLREWRRALRVSTVAGDGEAVVALLTDEVPIECLQAVGSALLSVAAADRPDGVDAIEGCIAGLRQRRWDGDDELADELATHLGHRPPVDLRSVPVDLEDLGDLLDGPAGAQSGLVDLQTGAVWPGDVLDNARDAGIDDVPEEADGTRWLEVSPGGHGGRDLRAFVATVSHPDVAERLDRAIRGKGAFRRFRQELHRWPHEASRWHAFTDDRRIGRARAWLADAGYRSDPLRSSSA